MKSKLKLLWVGDAGCSTGFARVSHAVLEGLRETGDFDIGVLGVNYFGWPNRNRGFRMYPASTGGQEYLGVTRLKEIYEKEQPDAVVLFQDFWHIADYIAHCPNMKGLLTYYPVDSPNMKPGWASYMATAAAVATYTQFGARETASACKFAWDNLTALAAEEGLTTLSKLGINSASGKKDIAVPAHRLKQLTDPKFINVIPHGLDLSRFQQIDKLEARMWTSMDSDWFVVLDVNRNQPRKRLDLAIQGFAKFAIDKPNARLVFHCWGGGGPFELDLEQLAEFYGVKDKVIMNHRITPDLTDEGLNQLYNAADVVVNTGGGEGWGLPAFEAAASNIPLIQPDWSATKELWAGAAMLTPVISHYHEVQKINTQQGVIDTDVFAAQLQELYDDPKKREAIGQACGEVTRRPEYKWDVVVKQFSRLIKHAAEKKPDYRAVTL